MPIEKLRAFIGQVIPHLNEKEYRPLATSSLSSPPDSQPDSLSLPLGSSASCSRRSSWSQSPANRRRLVCICVLGLISLTALSRFAGSTAISDAGQEGWATGDAWSFHFKDSIKSVFESPAGAGGWDQHGRPNSLLDQDNLTTTTTTIILPDPSLYKSFLPSELPNTKSRDWMTTLRPSRFLPEADGCLEQWFEHGTVCDGLTQTRRRRDSNVHAIRRNSLPLGPEEQLDVIYIWVNGTDPIWQDTQETSYTAATIPSTPRKHYRERNELKYTMRSVKRAFTKKSLWGGESSHLRKVHVVTADMPLPKMTISGVSEEIAEKVVEETSKWRIGQLPSWIKPSVFSSSTGEKPTPDVPDLQWHFHSEIFRLPGSYIDSDDARWTSESEWKELSVPSFNSFGIENMLAWMDDLSEFAIQANDDMFFLSSLSTSDFYSPLYGTVIRLDGSLMVRPLFPSKKDDGGEWTALQYANWLLSQRFPNRSRNYIIHAPKVLSLPILQEVTSIWTEEIVVSATRPFRESTNGDGDIDNAFLVTHHRIERWREALLWTWVMGKMGAREGGKLGRLAREEVGSVFGTLDGLVTFPISKDREISTESEVRNNFDKAGWDAPQSTKYHFSSFDGHLPVLGKKPSSVLVCQMDMATCFGREFLSGEDVDAQDIFKRVTFANWQCGDCIIQALVIASDKKGLSAFLPASGTRFKPSHPQISTTQRSPPHLPLSRTWQAADFSLDSVILPASDLSDGGPSVDGSVDLRLWSMKLLSRYSYVIGDSPILFQPIRSTAQARLITQAIENQSSLAMGCLNDDVPDRMAEGVATVLQNWMEGRWGEKSKVWWER